MGVRLRGFDYTQPYFYMVTVKRADGFPEFARVVYRDMINETIIKVVENVA